jgi:uncharacterized SAM-binding protein YcdF (DUF218 family)
MREFLSLIISPIPVLYLLLLAGFVLFGLKRKRIGKIFVLIAGVWFFIITTPFFPKIIVSSLESKYPQLSDSLIKNFGSPCDIIVLGAEHTDNKNLSPNNQLSLIALSRLTEGIHIHRMIRGSRLILSGYGRRSSLSHALVLYRTALILGVDSASMAIQPFPSNTRMEAEEYVKNFGVKNNLILVTSAIHMPRAMLNFHKEGINPIAAPTGFILKNGSQKYPWEWMPFSDNIIMMEESIHEYAGIMLTKIGGK